MPSKPAEMPSKLRKSGRFIEESSDDEGHVSKPTHRSIKSKKARHGKQHDGFMSKIKKEKRASKRGEGVSKTLDLGKCMLTSKTLLPNGDGDISNTPAEKRTTRKESSLFGSAPFSACSPGAFESAVESDASCDPSPPAYVGKGSDKTTEMNAVGAGGVGSLSRDQEIVELKLQVSDLKRRQELTEKLVATLLAPLESQA